MFNTDRQITSLTDVKKFAEFLYQEGKVAFHPDEPFENYVEVESSFPTFSKAKAKKLNKRMEEAFAICANENVDIYEFMMQPSPIH